VLNEFIFLPPVEQWSEKTLNLNNFRELFKGRPSLTGPVYFWEYVLNSTVYATCTTCSANLLLFVGAAMPWPSTSSAARMR